MNSTLVDLTGSSCYKEMMEMEIDENDANNHNSHTTVVPLSLGDSYSTTRKASPGSVWTFEARLKPSISSVSPASNRRALFFLRSIEISPVACITASAFFPPAATWVEPSRLTLMMA